MDDENVSFEYKDYRDEGKFKQMTISGVEFVHRYAQHVLPFRFVHIRHYGILAPGNRKVLASLQVELGHPPVATRNRGRKCWKDIAAAQGLVMGLCPTAVELSSLSSKSSLMVNLDAPTFFIGAFIRQIPVSRDLNLT